MTVIGLSGFAQSGKTTAALYLEKKYGVRRKHIAEPLRAMLAVLLQANGMSSEEITRYLEGDLKEQVIPCLGVTSRYAQITIGTEWGRNLISEDLWANTWARGIADGESVMNDSVRFPNEAKAIRGLGGFVIMIKRPGTRPAKFKHKLGEFLFDKFGIMWGVHPSERIDLIQPDYIIHNDSDVETLYADLDKAMAQHFSRVQQTTPTRRRRSRLPPGSRWQPGSVADVALERGLEAPAIWLGARVIPEPLPWSRVQGSRGQDIHRGQESCHLRRLCVRAAGPGAEGVDDGGRTQGEDHGAVAPDPCPGPGVESEMRLINMKLTRG